MNFRKIVAVGFFAIVPLALGASGMYFADYFGEFAGASIIAMAAPKTDPDPTRAIAMLETAEIIADEKSRDTIQIGWVGDIAPYRAGTNPSVDLFSEIAPLLRIPDMMIGNLEGALIEEFPLSYVKCPAGFTDCYQFVGDTQFAAHLREAGFDAMNLANNHGGDAGRSGFPITANILATNGMTPIGVPNQISYQKTGGVKIGFVGVSPFPGTTPMDEKTVGDMVKTASENADIVIVAFHGGKEGPNETVVSDRVEFNPSGQNRGNMYRMAHAAIEHGADLVLGSGPHVLRGMEVYKDRLIAYSLANFAANGSFNMEGVLSNTGILYVQLDKETGEFVSGNFVSAKLAKPGKPQLDIANESLMNIQTYTIRDFPASPLVIGPEGTIELGRNIAVQ